MREEFKDENSKWFHLLLLLLLSTGCMRHGNIGRTPMLVQCEAVCSQTFTISVQRTVLVGLRLLHIDLVLVYMRLCFIHPLTSHVSLNTCRRITYASQYNRRLCWAALQTPSFETRHTLGACLPSIETMVWVSERAIRACSVSLCECVLRAYASPHVFGL